MKRNNIISVVAFLVLCLIVAGSLASCSADAGNEQPAGETGGALSADEAYQSAIAAEEGEECTSDECTVNLYDDDGECPYNVMSPVGAVAGR